jgi:hypothetical protein
MFDKATHSCSHCKRFRFDLDSYNSSLHCYKDWSDVVKKAKSCRLLATVLDHDFVSYPRHVGVNEESSGFRKEVEGSYFLIPEAKTDRSVPGLEYNYWAVSLSLVDKELRRPIRSKQFHIWAEKGKFYLFMDFLVFCHYPA